MSKSPLFSTYRQGEHRVTSSMLAVFERIDVGLVEQLLAAATGEASLQMVSFENQPPGIGESVPDAVIRAEFAYWFEIKTTPHALGYKQLQQHLKNLSSGAGERLFVVTPDTTEPAVIADLADSRVVWLSFRSLYDAISTVLTDPTLLPGDRTQFLLSELQALFLEDGLIDSDDTVVVAARVAYGEYLAYDACVCQPGRRFREGLTHLAFHFKGAIQCEVPAILGIFDDVVFTLEEADRWLGATAEVERRVGAVIRELLGADPPVRDVGKPYEVFVLSHHGDERTVQLANAVSNDATDHNDKPTAWTMGQRYASLAALSKKGVRVTSDLEK